MSRWSPTVIDEGFDLGGIIDRIVQGYGAGRQQKEDRRRVKRQEKREDRDENRLLARLKAEARAEPGARDLAEFLGDPESVPTTLETRTRVGRADQPTVPIAFERPAPTEIKVPGQEEPIRFQERAPYITAPGVVMDPSAARGEQTLSTALDEQMKRRFDEPSETPEARIGRIGDEAEARARGTAAGTPDKTPEVSPPTLKAALEAIRAVYGTPGELVGDYTYPFGQERLGELLGGLTGIDFPKIEGPQPEPVEPPAETSEGISFWDSLRNKFVPGQPYGKEAAAPADTTGMRTALEPGKQAGEVIRSVTPAAPSPPSTAGGGAPADLVGRARALRQEHPDWTREQVIAELRRQDEAARRGQ